jgi:hypothetical protein
MRAPLINGKKIISKALCVMTYQEEQATDPGLEASNGFIRVIVQTT